MIRATMFGAVLAAGVLCGRADAARCSGYSPATVVYCDDFDSYCVGGTEWSGHPTYSGGVWAFPDACPAGATLDNDALRANWPASNEGTQPHELSTYDQATQSLPFALMAGGGQISTVRRAHNFTDAIQYRSNLNGQVLNGVNGTDANPLIFDVYMNFAHPNPPPNVYGNEDNAMYYVELTWGDDRADTDYVLKTCTPGEHADDPRTPGGHPSKQLGPFPILVQQWLNNNPNFGPVVPHPPLKNTVHKSVALGIMAALDSDPCNLDTGWRPSVWHISFFDGLKWFDLRSNVFVPGGDFVNDVGNVGESMLFHFRLEIKTTTMRFIYWNGNGTINSYATIPRLYTGPFNTIAEGPGMGCELDAVTGECKGPRKPFDFGLTNEGWKDAYMDAAVLTGGVLEFKDERGACCLPNATCSQMLQTECEAATGIFGGVGLPCEQIECCPNPPFDRDTDGDVDSADFGAFQRCLTIGSTTTGSLSLECKCFDVNKDGAVDVVNDLPLFGACASGPDVLATPGCQGI